MEKFSNSNNSVEPTLKCLEVWGGHQDSDCHLVRPGLDVWVWSQAQDSRSSGGGDIHLVSSCASGRITRMLVADISGNGKNFSHVAADLRETLIRNINSIQQARVLREISHRLETASSQQVYASALVGTFFAPTRKIEICNIGHPSPLIFRAESRQWTPLRKHNEEDTGRPLASDIIHPSEYQQFNTRIGVDDMLLCYSNVLTECRNEQGQTLGSDGLREIVQSLDTRTPEEIPIRLIEQVRELHHENLVNDDVTLLLCRGTRERVSWRDNLLAPFRLLRPVGDKTQIA